MERRQNGGRILEGVEWRGRMQEQNVEKTYWRKNSGSSRMEGKNNGTKINGTATKHSITQRLCHLT
jgi:hypothetical protein